MCGRWQYRVSRLRAVTLAVAALIFCSSCTTLSDERTYTPPRNTRVIGGHKPTVEPKQYLRPLKIIHLGGNKYRLDQ
jgi:hypothetical protein